jgi:nucleoside-diphosphate-sugar epimerase
LVFNSVSVRSPSFTILGAGGFIGSALVGWIESQDRPVHAVTRASLPALLASRRPCGHVIDCVGLTDDFRSRSIDTADAHVGLVARCLSELQFESFLLLSSTRVYRRARATHEDSALPALPADPSDLYNLTKLAGEALCLADQRHAVRVVRLSNVYGLGMPVESFLGEVLREGRLTGGVLFHQDPRSAEDYVNVAAVVRLMPAIATEGRHRIYNLAAGSNTSHGTIAQCLNEALGWQVRFEAEAPTVQLMPINTSRLDAEFGPTSGSLSADLPALLALEQECQC